MSRHLLLLAVGLGLPAAALAGTHTDEDYRAGDTLLNTILIGLMFSDACTMTTKEIGTTADGMTVGGGGDLTDYSAGLALDNLFSDAADTDFEVVAGNLGLFARGVAGSTAASYAVLVESALTDCVGIDNVDHGVKAAGTEKTGFVGRTVVIATEDDALTADTLTAFQAATDTIAPTDLALTDDAATRLYLLGFTIDGSTATAGFYQRDYSFSALAK